MKTSIQLPLEKTLKRRLSELPPFVEEFIYSLKNSKKIRTRIEYVKDIHLFFDFLAYEGKIVPPYKEVKIEIIESLQTREVQEFLDYLSYYEKRYINAAGQEKTQIYQNSLQGKSRKLASIREWFRFMEKREFISKNVARDIEFEGEKYQLMKDILQPGELKQLLDLFQSDTPIGKKNYAPELRQRDYTIILLFGYTGIRVSELIQLDRADIHFNKRSMIVYRKGEKPQRIPLSSKLIEGLNTYLTYRNSLTAANPLDKDAVFLSRDGNRLSDQSVRKLLKKYGEAINASTKLTPHVLRRTFGTEHYNRYGDMDLTATLLGHSNTGTTRKHYAQANEERIRKSLEEFDYE